ncbi:uroporphyrinogen-III synthase [Hydrocarboniclastica marina]|uniref:Uroporphyrinogen-III synthase n=1 Tax=Hydrocarboniclastica marina TaxID=2259620 RepID=A0A4P7XK30_9ALTE|nr:uroporphyrinogen-III synthase [Hydrocarboniclastica marina]QCF27368.1 uroporphyrinogen-III synthase [Hydrocarboniclastica marina]
MTFARNVLSGRRILVCRPEPRASELCRELQRSGADARALPMLAIAPVPETGALRTAVMNFDQFRHVIVVSPIAAGFLLDYLDQWWPQRPTGQAWYAVGSGTAGLLEQADISCLRAEQGHDSESLLQLPELARLDNQKLAIVGGEGGRNLLAEELTQRGGLVSKLALYRRLKPDYAEERLVEALVDFDPQALVVLSGETLNNLLSLGQNVDNRLRLRGLLVPTARVAEQARSAGFTRVAIASDLSFSGLEQALADVFSAGTEPGPLAKRPRPKDIV